MYTDKEIKIQTNFVIYPPTVENCIDEAGFPALQYGKLVAMITIEE